MRAGVSIIKISHTLGSVSHAKGNVNRGKWAKTHANCPIGSVCVEVQARGAEREAGLSRIRVRVGVWAWIRLWVWAININSSAGVRHVSRAESDRKKKTSKSTSRTTDGLEKKVGRGEGIADGWRQTGI